VVSKGGKLQQETRRWDDESGQTFLMRSKEMAHDYRYFPDPDLLPVDTTVFMDEVRGRRPELPAEKRERFVSAYGITEYDASVLANDLPLAAYFETAAKGAKKPKNVANWILNDLQSALSAAGHSILDCPIPPQALDELVNLIDVGVISGKQGKEVFAEMFATGKAASIVVEEKGLKQESDVGALEILCQQAIDANPKAVAEYRAGKASSINFLKGQVMKLSQGKANPALIGDVLLQKLS
jgi:aspartyl-tRNA(Asn)/glutamyl-tRNA(Gln) amidotransferase subunit B